MTEYVSESVRDEVMELILNYPENNLCFDCGSKNPTWASAYLGVLICFECAGRHRSYGTHISFIRSINLDKWNKKQLKSMEITGNKFAREAFNELGIQKTAGIYDYDSSLIQKYKNELANKVKELLEMEDLRNGNITKTYNSSSASLENSVNRNGEQSNDNYNSSTHIKSSKNLISNNLNQKDNKENLHKEKQVDEQKTDVKFTGLKIEEAKQNSSNQKKPETKISKTSKIKKVDFDFDFDSFNDINFSNFENNDTKAKNSAEIKEDPFASYDEKKNEENNNYSNSNGGSYLNENNTGSGEYLSLNNNIVITDKIRQEADKKFANKKAVGWEDYANLTNDSEDNSAIKDKLNSMKNQQAVSYSDLYGGDDYEESDSITSKLKDFAWGFTVKAAEKAKSLKDKTTSMINKIQQKYGQ